MSDQEVTITPPVPPTIEITTPGPQGASAYEIAVANGFVGTEAQWLASLQGVNGPNNVSTSTTTPINAILKGNGTNVLGATPGVDYATPASVSAVQGNLDDHENDTANPHAVTKTQVGLPLVQNLDQTDPANIVQDATHRFATDAEKATWNAKQAALGFTPENAANKGAAGGYAPLDGSSKIAAAYLPSYVDDVVEYANLAAFPVTGETGKIYVALDTNKIYRWSGSIYAEISASPGSTDAVPEGATNLYHTAARVRSTVLTGLSLATGTAITAADTILSAAGKLQKQISDTITAVVLRELLSNKIDDLLTPNSTEYPTTNAVVTELLKRGLRVDVQQFGSSGTWQDPTLTSYYGEAPQRVHVFLVGAGGGGGSGRKGLSGTVRSGGGGGGGAMITRAEIAYNQIADATVVVGSGGVGGASQTTNSTNGVAGTGGGQTTFAGFKAVGGGGGAAGSTGAAAGGSAGGTNTICSVAGTAGGASSATGAAGAAGGAGTNQNTGGGSGGGITTANAASAGGAGGLSNTGFTVATAAGGTAGAVNNSGGAGNSVTAFNEMTFCSGGGGGGASTTTNAGAGGDGGYRGGGGGGGGAAVDSVGNSGKGGNAQNGYAIIISEF